MRFTALASLFLLAAPVALRAQGTPDDQLPASYLNNVVPHSSHSGNAAGSGGVLGNKSNASVLGVDSVTNWSSYFYLPGFDSFGGTQYTWQYTMVGNSPFQRNDQAGEGDSDFSGATTKIGAPVIPVNLDLRNYDGSPRYLNGKRMYLDATQLVNPVLKSPVFSNTNYDSSERPTQFTDAVQKAEFYNKSQEDWHTILKPRVGTPRTMVLIRGTYRFGAKTDGTLTYVLVDANAFGNALFPATPSDTSTPIGAAENSGDIQTKDISTFLFNNVFLYSNGDPNQCCIIGYHTYDVEPGSAANGNREKRYVVDYASWISPGVFRDPSFADVAALSHELSETFNDPFVNNSVPWWLAPNGNCQNNLETGDVTEGLPNAQYPISLNGMTYHPQNEALLQWFAGVVPSSAINHAYSYPDTRVLTSAATLQKPGCTP